jgi:hypothetical protein
MGKLIRDFTPTPLFWILAVLLYGGIFGGIGYVAIHFIAKYW